MTQIPAQAGYRLEWLMTRERGSKAAARTPHSRNTSRQQRRPSRIGCVARCRNALLVPSGEINGVERWPSGGIAEEHHHAAVGRPGRAFIVEAFGEDALAFAFGRDHADRKLALRLLGEGDGVAARRPYRRRIGALAKADALCAAA